MKTIVNNNINTVEVALYNIPITPFSLEILRKRISRFCSKLKISVLNLRVCSKLRILLCT